MKITKRLFLKSAVAVAFVVAASLIGTSANAADHAHGHGTSTLNVEGGWARATAKVAKNGAAYFKVTNNGETADKLIAAKSAVGKKTSLHTHINDGSIMKMRPIKDVPVAVGETVEFKPGGHHIMLMGLNAPLAEGAMFPITLVFEKAGDVEVMVHVKGTKGDMKAMEHKHSH